MAEADDNGKITRVPYDPALPVHTAWDLGINDSTAIWFAQVYRGGAVNVIDYYENSGVGLDHYAEVLRKKDYHWGDHLAPHDIEVRELGSGKSRLETAFSLGIRFKVIPRMKIADGINAARMIIPSAIFIEINVQRGWKCCDSIGRNGMKRKRYSEISQGMTLQVTLLMLLDI